MWLSLSPGNHILWITRFFRQYVMTGVVYLGDLVFWIAGLFVMGCRKAKANRVIRLAVSGTGSFFFNECIAAVSSEIESFQEQLKEKKAKFKQFNAEKEQEDQKRLAAAIFTSGKNIDEVISMIGAGESN